MDAIHRNSCTKFINFTITSIILLIVAHQSQQGNSILHNSLYTQLIIELLAAPNLKCGRTKFNSRIAGGNEAIANEFPWMVHFQVMSRDGQLSSICGGSLISGIHVLTATHCVTHDGINMNDIFNITLGIHDVTVRRQTVEWKTIVIPALSDDVKQDIAIITLSDPVNFTGTT
jgi:secreted trypsin-like serine protease